VRGLAATVAAAVAALTLVGAASASRARGDFVVADGTQLYLKGKPYRFTGINVYNANSRDNCWYTMGSGPLLGQAMDALGPGRVIRAWFFQELATTNGVRDWAAFDHTLAVARDKGERVIVTLGNEWNDCEVQEGFKDESWYASRYRTPSGTNPMSYRDFVAQVVERYKRDPTVLMWQLLNEAEDPVSFGGACSATSATTLRSWAGDMSSLVKSIDGVHLLTIGTIGSGQCGASWVDYKTLYALPDVDLCEVHHYGADPFGGDAFNGLRLRIQQCAELGKPIFNGEVGLRPSDLPGGTLQARADAFRAKLDAHFAAGFVGELLWAWSALGSTLDNYDIGPGDPALAVLRSY
jgi:mannan endo-1,4-beta-mannosidase